MRNFRKLEVWKESMELVEVVYGITRQLPTDEKYGLCSQMKRATVAIPANIAEGSSRRTSADFARFLDISLGSSFELETYLELVKKIHQNNSIEELQPFLNKLHIVQKRINALRESIVK
jgi:four helix bundle protein